MLEDCKPRLICGTRESLTFMQRQPEFSVYEYFFTEEIDDSFSNTFIQPKITPVPLAFLQYTSGSTGVPKGVMVNHFNIMANERAIQHYFNCTEQDTCISWLPLQHDMGLICGLIYAIYTGMTEVFMARPPFYLNLFFG